MSDWAQPQRDLVTMWFERFGDDMRMWGVPPAMLCRRHLIGEHNEVHMFVGAINKGFNLDGYLTGELLDVNLLRPRHADLVVEMGTRHHIHLSPLPPFNYTGPTGQLDIKANILELTRRCPDCRERILHVLRSKSG